MIALSHVIISRGITTEVPLTYLKPWHTFPGRCSPYLTSARNHYHCCKKGAERYLDFDQLILVPSTDILEFFKVCLLCFHLGLDRAQFSPDVGVLMETKFLRGFS